MYQTIEYIYIYTHIYIVIFYVYTSKFCGCIHQERACQQQLFEKSKGLSHYFLFVHKVWSRKVKNPHGVIVSS